MVPSGAESGVGRQVRLVLRLSRRRLELSEGRRPTATFWLIFTKIPSPISSRCLRLRTEIEPGNR